MKHDVCPICVKLKVPTTYWCGVNCPANPEAWNRHAPYHKKVKRQQARSEDGGVLQQRNREVAERTARYAAQSGDAYDELLAEGSRYLSKDDTRRAARAFRAAIALGPDEPVAYYNLGGALANSWHIVEAAQRYLEAKERFPVGSEMWQKCGQWPRQRPSACWHGRRAPRWPSRSGGTTRGSRRCRRGW